MTVTPAYQQYVARAGNLDPVGDGTVVPRGRLGTGGMAGRYLSFDGTWKAPAGTVDLADLAGGGNGSDNNRWTGCEAAITAGDVPYVFRPGHYAFATPLAFSFNRLKLYGMPGAVLHYTGGSTSAAVLTVTCPTGNNTSQIEDVILDGLTVDGGGNAGLAVEAIGCHGSLVRRLVGRGVTFAVYRSKWAVNNTLERIRYHSTYEGGTPPTNGLILDAMGGDLTTVNTLRNCWIVGVPGVGFWLKGCFGCVAEGGAAEFNGTNLLLDGSNNALIGTGFEAGPSVVNGSGNSLRNNYSGTALTINGAGNTVADGNWGVVTVNAYGNDVARSGASSFAGPFPPTEMATAPAGGFFLTGTANGDLAIRVPSGKAAHIGTAAQAGGAATVRIDAAGVATRGNLTLTGGEIVVADGAVGGSVGAGNVTITGAAASLNIFRRGTTDLSSQTPGDRWAHYALGGAYHVYTGGTGDVLTVQADGKWLFPFGFGVGNAAAASTPGTVVKKVPIYDAAGSLLGYVPVYNAIT